MQQQKRQHSSGQRRRVTPGHATTRPIVGQKMLKAKIEREKSGDKERGGVLHRCVNVSISTRC